MPFIQDILKYRSVSIVGMAKNTGKTTCLNYILDRLEENKCKVAVTSIGVDGEERDVLYDTLKPRIFLKKGNYFITSEKHFAECELKAKVLSISNKTTALGRLVTAQVQQAGRIILSGPSDSVWLHSCIESMSDFDVDITLVDGALSRMSLASPAITDAMILCTGAAYSIQLEQLIKQVKYLCDLIDIPQVNEDLFAVCNPIQEGVWALKVAAKKEILAEKIADSLFLNSTTLSDLLLEKYVEKYEYFFVNGALTEDFLKMLTLASKYRVSKIKLIVRNFSRIFVLPATFKRFIRSGGSIYVLQKANLLAICSNPTSPEGYSYEPELLRATLQKKLNIPVYDIVQIKKVSQILL